MFSDVKIIDALSRERKKFHTEGDIVLHEVHKILNKEQFAEKNILRNLKDYNKSFELLDEEGLDSLKIYGKKEIRNICIQYNLRFLDSQLYKGKYPPEAIHSIKELQRHNRTEFKSFKILGPVEIFKTKNFNTDPILFAETNHGNFYLIHQWGHKVPWYASAKHWPFRKFENLIITIILITALITLAIPNKFLVMGNDFGYWDTHRFAAFFHLLIINTGLTVFFCFAFHKNFSSSVWDELK